MKTRSQVLILFGAMGCVALAQDQADAPGRAARLSFISGMVSFQPGTVEDWVPATLNRPLTTGDRLWTDDGARAEMNIGSAAFRLSGRTNFSFINLDDRTAQAQLSLGTLSVRVRRLAEDEVMEVDTPQVALSLLRPGEYRIDVNEQGDTTIVTVRGGQAEANAGQAFSIQPREQVRITGAAQDGAQPVFDRREMPPADPFDNWCIDRDRREDLSQSAKYVSREMPGYSDLDASGGWRMHPEYGAVWYPTAVPAGWAPYHYGHWAWVAPWGWTWVDDAPWGYAPFHYGRWVVVGGAWGWVPGPVVVGVRPVYAPALVAWVGGGGFSVAVGIGGGVGAVGWFPLAPREVFVPAYRYSPAYIERVNVTNTVIVNRTVFNNVNVANVTYVNRNVVGAVTAVPANAMVAGRPVSTAAIRVPPGAMERAQFSNVAAVAPQREAVFGGRAATNVMPPAAALNRAVVTRTAPPPAPVAFQHQQAALAANPGRPLNTSQVSQIRSTAPPSPQRANYRMLNAGSAPTPTVNRTPAPQQNQTSPQNQTNVRREASPGNPSQPLAPRREIGGGSAAPPARPANPQPAAVERQSRPAERVQNPQGTPPRTPNRDRAPSREQKKREEENEKR